jgi:OFA family oxalate/formate antiporter-like MFS transporter
VFTWGAVVPYVRAEGWPDPLIGAVFSATPLGYGTAAVLGGRLADRLPPRRLCWLSLALLGTGFAVAFLLPGPLTFVVFYSFLALGIGGGIAITGSLAAAVHAFPLHRGSAGGILTGVYALGAVVQLPVVERLASVLGWVGALRGAGAVLALASLLALLGMPAVPARAGVEDGLERPGPLLRRRRLLTAMLAVAALSPFGTYAFVNAGVFASGAGLASGVGVAALVAVAVGNAIGRIGAGIVADQLGVNGIVGVLAVCELAAGPVLVASAAHSAVVSLVAACLVAGLVLGGAAGVMARAAAEAAPDAPQSAFGLMFGGYAFGALAGPLLGPEFGRGALPWLVLSALGVVAGGLAVLRSAPAWGPARAPQR